MYQAVAAVAVGNAYSVHKKVAVAIAIVAARAALGRCWTKQRHRMQSDGLAAPCSPRQLPNIADAPVPDAVAAAPAWASRWDYQWATYLIDSPATITV